MSAFVDPLGFTKQTETLLCGVGAANLIQEFKKRNISTDTLHKLTKEDLIKLGANEAQAENMVKVLCVSKEKNKSVKTKPCYRISDKVDILKAGEKQLDIIKAFLTYCRLRLREERINSFVEVDEALSSSQILCIAADAVLIEINEAELKLKELQAVITPRSNEKYSPMLYCIPVGGFCIATCMLLIRFWS